MEESKKTTYFPPVVKKEIQSFIPGLEQPEDYIIKKHNAIIHRTHASTPTEEKMFSALLMAARAQLKNDMPSDGKFHTTIKFLRNFGKIAATNNQIIKDALTGLQEHPWQYDMFVEDAFQEWRSFPPISEVRIDKLGSVTFFFAPTIQEALNNPSIYTQIDLKIIRGLKSVYSIALYELGLSHAGESKEFGIAEFRNYMGLKEHDYSDNSDLRRYVLEPAVNEVNEKTDIRVELRLVKNGPRGAMTGFIFSFTQIEEVEILPDSQQLELIAELCAMLPDNIGSLRGVVPLLKKQLELRGEEIVRSNIQYFVERVNDKNQAPIPSPGGYLRRVLENDYGVEIRERIVVEKLTKEKKEQAALVNEVEKLIITETEQSKEKADIDEVMLIQGKYFSYYQSLPPDQQTTILNRIEEAGCYSGPLETKVMAYFHMEEKLILE